RRSRTADPCLSGLAQNRQDRRRRQGRYSGLSVNLTEINRAEINRAAEIIRAGRLVAFPTETVYGLGANALDPSAVARIFLAKGRPRNSPLIVHVDSSAMAREFAAVWPDAAETLARRYWPGPLTLVVPKHPRIPDIV